MLLRYVVIDGEESDRYVEHQWWRTFMGISPASAAARPSVDGWHRQSCVLAWRRRWIYPVRVCRVLRHLGANDAAPWPLPVVDHSRRCVCQLPGHGCRRGLRPGQRRLRQPCRLLGILSRWPHLDRQEWVPAQPHWRSLGDGDWRTWPIGAYIISYLK